MDTIPLVSVVTPSYNQGRFIEDTLLSVKNQDYPNIEHIVVDGGSTDNTVEVLKKYEGTYNMRWISEPDKGQSDGTNKGLRMAKGEIIGCLNSDDLYFDKQTVSCVVREFSESGDADVIHGNNIIIDQNNLVLRVAHRASQITLDKMLRLLGYMSQPATFIRKASLGNFELDVELHYAPHSDLYFRLLKKKLKFEHLDRIVACHRQHGSMKSFHLRSVSAEARLVRARHGQAFRARDRVLTWWELGRRASLRIKGIPTIVDIYLHRDRYDFAFNPKFDSVFKALVRQIAYWELVRLGIIRYKVQRT